LIFLRYTEKKRIIGEQAALLLQASAVLNQEMKNVVKSKRGMASSQGRKLKRLENEFKRVMRACNLELLIINRTFYFWKVNGRNWNELSNQVI
jgi:hypothetical protein